MKKYQAFTMSRRHFLQGSLAVSSGFLISPVHTIALGDESLDPLVEAIRQFVQKHSLPAAIGKQYLKNTQQSLINTDTLLHSLAATLKLTRSDFSAVPIPDLLAERISQDFKEDRLCNIDGWLLALTECRLAGLKALLADEAREVAKKASTFADWPIRRVAQIKAWGPKQTNLGEAFNPQSSGASALWIDTAWLNEGLQVALGGVLLHTTIGPTGTISADLAPDNAPEIINKQGSYPVYLLDTQNQAKQLLGDFLVKPGSEQGLEFGIIDWGPKLIKKGQGFNRQPDGSSAWWFKFQGQLSPATACHIKLDSLALPTTINPDASIISARLDNQKALQMTDSQGTYTISLECAGHSDLIGQFIIE